MAEVTASMVKALREKTGAGMMDCKTALMESQGDIEKSVDWLRKKGLSRASQKADRVAAEGLIGVTVRDRTGAIVEVNSETDFVARNDRFQDMVRTVATVALDAGGDIKKLLATPYPGTSMTVEAYVKELVATIGENMSVRRTAQVSASKGLVAEYIHNKAADGLGKVGVLVSLESEGKAAELATFGRQLAMHVAAASPAAVSAEELDPALIERERIIYTEQAQASGKPPEIAAKMAEGRLRKEFFQRVVLLQQTFLGPGGDGKATVEQVLKAAEKVVGAPIKVTGFVRYALGEGIDKKDTDFAAEVAAAAGKR